MMKKILLLMIFLLSVRCGNAAVIATGGAKTTGPGINAGYPPIHIFTQGDSLTEQGGTSDGFAYRKNLQIFLAPRVITMYGGFTNPSSDPTYGVSHNGHSGDDAGVEDINLQTWFFVFPTSSLLRRVVIIQGGSNDASILSDNLATSAATYANMASYIWGISNTTDIYELTCIPRTDNSAYNTRVDTFNGLLVPLLQAKQASNSHMHIVDMNAAYLNTANCATVATCLSGDGLHPNAQGELVYAQVIANCINNSNAQYCDGH